MGEASLLPCPFCGGKSTVTKWFAVDGSKRPDWWVVSCVFGCGKSSEELEREHAVSAWNKRAPALQSENTRLLEEDQGSASPQSDTIEPRQTAIDRPASIAACDPAEAVLLDLLEGLQEGLMCDAGLTDDDRAAMRWQITALDEALAQTRDIPRPAPEWSFDLARGLRLIAKHSRGTVSLCGELLSFEDLLGIAAREIEPLSPARSALLPIGGGEAT